MFASKLLAPTTLILLSSCQLPVHAPQALPPEHPSEQVVLSVTVASLTPIQEEQRQQLGDVAVSVEPVPFSLTRRVQETRSLALHGYVESAKSADSADRGFLGNVLEALDQRQQGPDANTCEVVDIRSEPSFLVEPNTLQFKIRVLNNHQRVLHLEGSVFSFAVDGKDIAIPEAGYSDLMHGILVPGSQKEFLVSGPSRDALPDHAVVALNLFDVPTSIDKAGTITEKSGFTWHFEYSIRQETKEDAVVYKRERIPWTEVACETCAGSGVTGKVRCYTCGGGGIKRGQSCSVCGGSGQQAQICPTCFGKGKRLAPPPVEVAGHSSSAIG